jgi:NitT/TauT family transport system substrate-binding protein
MMKPDKRAARGLAFLSALAMIGLCGGASAAEKVRVALGDVLSVETLAVAVALERARDRGVDYEMTSFAKEQLAIQAIVNGQMDIGIGTPYSVIQKAKVPLRNIFQMSRGVFFAVADKEKYPDWKSLDGQPFTFHGRGSGTEAIGNIIAKREGITFGDRNYVPGSENRIIAMMNGQIGATIVDLANKNLLMSKAGDRFHVLPGLSEPASDELVFASADWLKANQDKADIIVEEFLKLWREMNEDPGIVEEERAKRGLLADQPKEILAEVVPFYTEGTKEGLFDPNGGGEKAAKSDFDFFTEAGQLAGPASGLKVEDYWDLGPLKRAAAKLGG